MTKKLKKWGIKVNGKWWIQSVGEDATYYMKQEAQKDANDFNTMRIGKEKVYTVEEYK
jgi:hypothetical protein